MNKIKIVFISIAWVALLTHFLIFVFCTSVDKVFAEPAYEIFLKNRQIINVNKESCADKGINEISKNACRILFKEGINSAEIIKTYEQYFDYADTISYVSFNIENFKDNSIFYWALSIFKPSVYEIYSEQISYKYISKESYSYINVIGNLKLLSKRLTTSICFPQFKRNDLVIKKNNNILVLSDKPKSFIVKNVYENIEEIIIFKKKHNKRVNTDW